MVDFTGGSFVVGGFAGDGFAGGGFAGSLLGTHYPIALCIHACMCACMRMNV